MPKRSRGAGTAKTKSLPRVGRPQHDVMAIVNGKDISRKQLTDACVRRFGEDVLESLVNKRLIANHCAKRGITVTNEEITAEIDRMAKRFQLGREQWLDLLQKERGVSPQEYARDIVWPTLALRKLADEPVAGVAARRSHRAYEQAYGEMVRARLIAVSDAAKAQKLQAELTAHPDNFAAAGDREFRGRRQRERRRRDPADSPAHGRSQARSRGVCPAARAGFGA